VTTRRTGVRAAALLVALLAACGSLEGRLEAANSRRHDGKPKEALTAYRSILAQLGDGPLSGSDAGVRVKALKYAAEISYLELGDYAGAIAYYRRIVSLEPATADAFEARGAIGDIYRERFNDPLAAIAQYADVAARDAAVSPAFQLKVIRAWLELKSWEQARTEARALRERWPAAPEADESQLLTAQAWAFDGKPEEALGAYRALVERRPAPDLVARALEGEAALYAQSGRFDRALELYSLALPTHPNPEAVRTAIEAVGRRREAAKTAKPGDRTEAFDYGLRPFLGPSHVPPRPSPGAAPETPTAPAPAPQGPAATPPPAAAPPAPAAAPPPTPGASPGPQEPRP
jgi:tetratricopeptide (TPR) repeat protein